MLTFCPNELTYQLKQKKLSAFGDLYDLYAPALLGYILKHHYAPEENETILIIIFRKAWNQIDSFDPAKLRLLTWLFQLTQEEITVRYGKALHPFGDQFLPATYAGPKTPAQSRA